MNKLELYEATLVQLAEQGNEQAKLALQLGGKAEFVNVDMRAKESAAHIHIAIKNLNNALRENEDSWTRRTDSYIRSAITDLTEAMQRLIP